MRNFFRSRVCRPWFKPSSLEHGRITMSTIHNKTRITRTRRKTPTHLIQGPAYLKWHKPSCERELCATASQGRRVQMAAKTAMSISRNVIDSKDDQIVPGRARCCTQDIGDHVSRTNDEHSRTKVHIAVRPSHMPPSARAPAPQYCTRGISQMQPHERTKPGDEQHSPSRDAHPVLYKELAQQHKAMCLRVLAKATPMKKSQATRQTEFRHGSMHQTLPPPTSRCASPAR